MRHMNFLKSYEYSRSVMERVILEAGQFAHVSLCEIKDVFDELTPSSQVRVWVENQNGIGGKFHNETAFYHQTIFGKFQEKFGTLCPLCLRPLGYEQRSPSRNFLESDLMPTWIFHEHYDRWSPYANHEKATCFKDNRFDHFLDWGRGTLHPQCSAIANTLYQKEPLSENDMEYLIWALKQSKKKTHPWRRPFKKLRFNVMEKIKEWHVSDMRNHQTWQFPNGKELPT